MYCAGASIGMWEWFGLRHGYAILDADSKNVLLVPSRHKGLLNASNDASCYAPAMARAMERMRHRSHLLARSNRSLDEALADLLIKAWTGVLAKCPEDDTCGAWVLWVSVCAWVLSAFASALWWYRKVLARYETTVALPIEYGALNAASALTGGSSASPTTLS